LTDSLRALVSNLIDYAGLYPPAGLPLEEVLARYGRYRSSPECWMLNRLVLPASKLAEARLEDGWRVTLLVEGETGPLPKQVETVETKGGACFSLPTYVEAPFDRISNGFAKIRTGGLTPDAIPSSQHLADFLHATAARRLPFKATAGLHHPVRAGHPLTYAPDAPRAVMHGFLNVFVGAAFAWMHAPLPVLTEVLEETDARAFEFRDGELRWRGHSVSTRQIADARANFAHSFGSCSFEEPVEGLQELGLLP